MTKIQNKEELFQRYKNNPIITPNMWPYPINTVFNAGATRLSDGTTLLLCRVEDLTGRSHLSIAKSKDGVSNWKIESNPALIPETEDFPEEYWGIEDSRITYIPELEKFAIAYTAYSRGGPGVSLALTKDFKEFERLGMIMPPEDKDAALLPCRINGLWALIHRPVMRDIGAHIWISFSPDLIYWGKHKMILKARKGGWWDANKIGLSTPLIETSEGWLMIYHGVKRTAGGCLYRLGLALFALDDPSNCLMRGDSWVFGPETSYERGGDVPNVVFPCGYTIEDDKDIINLYYGAADTCIALAKGSIKKLLEWLKKNSDYNR